MTFELVFDLSFVSRLATAAVTGEEPEVIVAIVVGVEQLMEEPFAAIMGIYLDIAIMESSFSIQYCFTSPHKYSPFYLWFLSRHWSFKY